MMVMVASFLLKMSPCVLSFFCLPTTHIHKYTGTQPCFVLSRPVQVLSLYSGSHSSPLPQLFLSKSLSRQLACSPLSRYLYASNLLAVINPSELISQKRKTLQKWPLNHLGRYSKKSSYRDSLLDNLGEEWL